MAKRKSEEGVKAAAGDDGKKSRTIEPTAVVTDEFTSEAVREVPAEAANAEKDTQSDMFKLSHSVRHQVAIPPGYDYVPLSKHVPSNPCLLYTSDAADE